MRMTPERPKVARSRSGANAAGQWERKGARASKRKENAMATYVTLINFTDQGIKNIKDTANRASHYKELAAKLGCTLKEIWWTQGQYDVVSVVEAPDEASMTALAMSLGKLGYVRTQTLRAYAAKELAPIMDKVV
jgi:uncharacterized protein with GYD domain